MYTDPFGPRQREFIENANATFNIAHGCVRSGKTVCSFYRFLEEVWHCPGEQIWMIGHTLSTIYDNVIQLLFNSPPLNVFKPISVWLPGRRQLKFGMKTIHCLGATDERAIGPIQGKTFDLCYCDEMTLYPENVIQMIITRLSMPHSKLFASLNPMQPTHIIKEQMINRAIAGDPKYYALKFGIDDNPFLTESYKQTLRDTLSGVFYKRNYLGEWCLAEGAVYDFLERGMHILPKAKRCADFWLAGVDYGTSNAFACVLVGYSSGHYTQTDPHMWVEKEYYWDSEKMGRQKTNADYARDLEGFFEGYSLRACYIDPSAESFHVELRRKNIRVVHANNDVYNGIMITSTLIKEGSLTILEGCRNLIREMEGYVWDHKKAEKGEDAPLKKNDHAVDALRYVCASFMKGRTTLKVPHPEDIYKSQREKYMKDNWPHGEGFRPF